jgi:hypothetical protein
MRMERNLDYNMGRVDTLVKRFADAADDFAPAEILEAQAVALGMVNCGPLPPGGEHRLNEAFVGLHTDGERLADHLLNLRTTEELVVILAGMLCRVSLELGK